MIIVLVIGGTASGKSEYAEKLTQTLGKNRVYMATMEPYDDECYKKIDRHRAMRRERGFSTVEMPRDLHLSETLKHETVLLECMSNLLANESYCKSPKINIISHIQMGINHLIENSTNLVIVSNQIFCDSISYNEDMLKYIDNLGTINNYIAKKADVVIEVVVSIPILHKGEIII